MSISCETTRPATHVALLCDSFVVIEDINENFTLALQIYVLFYKFYDIAETRHSVHIMLCNYLMIYASSKVKEIKPTFITGIAMFRSLKLP